MRKFWLTGLCVGLICGLGGGAWGDTVEMTDGTVKTGTVTRQTNDEVFLRVDQGGLMATVKLLKKNVAKITLSEEPSSAPGSAGGSAPEPVVEPEVKVAPRRMGAGPVAVLPPTHGFLQELGYSALGAGPNSVQRLPVELQALWVEAATLAKGKDVDKVALLESLHQLADTFERIEGGEARLNAVCRRERKEPFGPWMAKVHWDTVADNYAKGQFELGDVREIERKALIGILREKTKGAVDPLKSYFPPVDAKTGRAEPYKPSQLAGITANNAVDVKKKAAYAMAVLQAQLKLEPDMPQVDKQLIGVQLGVARRAFGRAGELERTGKK